MRRLSKEDLSFLAFVLEIRYEDESSLISDLKIKWESMQEFRDKPHHGDCIEAPCSCVRCFLEDCDRQAEYMLEGIDFLTSLEKS